MDRQTLKIIFKDQANRMRKSIREEMEIWERALMQKYGIVQKKKKKKNE